MEGLGTRLAWHHFTDTIGTCGTNPLYTPVGRLILLLKWLYLRGSFVRCNHLFISLYPGSWWLGRKLYPHNCNVTNYRYLAHTFSDQWWNSFDCAFSCTFTVLQRLGTSYMSTTQVASFCTSGKTCLYSYCLVSLHGAKSGFHMGALGSLPQEKFENYDVIMMS